MKATYNVTGDERKALVRIISEVIGMKPANLRLRYRGHHRRKRRSGGLGRAHRRHHHRSSQGCPFRCGLYR